MLSRHSIIEQSSVIVLISVHNALSCVLDKFIQTRPIKRRTMSIELCGVNSHSSMQPAANSKSFFIRFHPIAVKSIYLDLLQNRHLTYSVILLFRRLIFGNTAFPLSVINPSFLSLRQRSLFSFVRLLFFLRFAKRCAETVSDSFLVVPSIRPKHNAS